MKNSKLHIPALGSGGRILTHDLGDMSPTSYCMFVFFKNKCSTTFAHYKTIAALRERTRSTLWVIVARSTLITRA